jgi:APA family basic amino acid/polyamine antiporter
LIVLALVIVAGLVGGAPHTNNLGENLFTDGWYGILQSAGLLFFAFAGYARIATMGQEVTNPARTIPRAILTALSITLVIYALIAVTVLLVIVPEQLAKSTAPMVDVVSASSWGWAAPVVRIGAAAAALGALLALVAGVGRTSLAMARNRDPPTWLAAVHPKYKVPHNAEIALAVIVIVIVVVLTVDLRGAIGFSSFGVLLYYFIANISAFTQATDQRQYPKALQILGAFSCLVLVVSLPLECIIVGLVVLVIGILYRLIRLRLRRRSATT